MTFRDLFNLHAEAARLVHEAPESLPNKQFDELSTAEHQLLVKLCRARVETTEELVAQIGYALKQDDLADLLDTEAGESLAIILLESVLASIKQCEWPRPALAATVALGACHA